jgi:LacI family transcriptional regulator, galactose operon repressor
VKERVLAAIQTFNYHPNALARGLRAKATKTIGIITTEVTNPFYSEVAVAAEAELMERGYTALISNILLDDRGSVESKEQNYVKTFLEHRVDGLLFTSVRLDSSIGQRLEKQGVPFVLLNRRIRDMVTDYVGVDNIGGMRAATEHLIQFGHRRIGFVGGFSYSSSAQDRLKGYLSALDAHAIKPESRLFFEGDYDLDGGYEGAKHLLSLPTEVRPTAICAANDFLALGIIDYAMNAGFRIPFDLSITGFDDILLSRIAPIGLTTVRQPLREMGRAAARLLVGRIEKPTPDKPSTIVLPCELVVRKTTMPPAGISTCADEPN